MILRLCIDTFEVGHHHRISGIYLVRSARKVSWKEDHRRTSNGLQLHTVIVLVTRTGPSVDFCGYCIGNAAAPPPDLSRTC